MSDGAVFKGLRVLPESVLLVDEGRIVLHNWRGLLKLRVQFEKKLLSQDTTYVIVHNTYTGYFHWLLESLPRILIAKENFAEFFVLLPDAFRDEFYRDSLDLLGIKNVELIHPAIIYKVPRLGLPYLLEPMGSFSPAIVADLKKKLLCASLSKTSTRVLPNIELLYVSRKKATRRKIVNEREVEDFLSDRGFTIICFEDYTLYEQIIICSEARVMISIHGAGLSNMLFMADNSDVIELRKFDANLNHTYERLAGALGYSYELLYCPAVNEEQSVQDADLCVDIAALQALME